MNSDELIATMRQKLHEAISDIHYLQIDDVSAKHVKHTHFQPGKYHFNLTIASAQLSQMSKIKAHQMIYQCLEDEIKHWIHALSIKCTTPS